MKNESSPPLPIGRDFQYLETEKVAFPDKDPLPDSRGSAIDCIFGLESPRISQSTKPGKEEGKADSRLRTAAPVTSTVRVQLILFIYTIFCIQLNVRIPSHLICRFKRNFSR